jgi:hypothetical protein
LTPCGFLGLDLLLCKIVSLDTKNAAMSEIKIQVDDKYLQAFLAFLDTLSYVKVEKISHANSQSTAEDMTEAFLSKLPPDSPLRRVVKPIRKGKVTAEDLMRESGYERTDWEKIREIGVAMDIEQSTEELLAQLTA